MTQLNTGLHVDPLFAMPKWRFHTSKTLFTHTKIKWIQPQYSGNLVRRFWSFHTKSCSHCKIRVKSKNSHLHVEPLFAALGAALTEQVEITVAAVAFAALGAHDGVAQKLPASQQILIQRLQIHSTTYCKCANTKYKCASTKYSITVSVQVLSTSLQVKSTT